MTTLNDFKLSALQSHLRSKKSFTRCSRLTLMLLVRGWWRWQRKRV